MQPEQGDAGAFRLASLSDSGRAVKAASLHCRYFLIQARNHRMFVGDRRAPQDKVCTLLVLTLKLQLYDSVA